MGCTGSTSMDPTATEITLECSDGIVLAAQSWQRKVDSTRGGGIQREELRILCLHGWMDNSGSFNAISKALISQLETNSNVHIVALDLPGHGLSSHKSKDSPPMVRAEYLFYVAEAVRLLQWCEEEFQTPQNQKAQKFILVGHSMGAGVSLMYTAAFPEQVRQVIFLDNVGSVARPAENTSQCLRDFVQARQRDGPVILQPENLFYYPTQEAAFKARCRSASYLPGKQYISEEAARELVRRGVVQETGSNRFRFRHDPRLPWTSLQYFSPEQLEALYRDIQCPTCVLLAKHGWPIDEDAVTRVKNTLKPTVLGTLPGSHHFHADPDSRDMVVTEIVNFLQMDTIPNS